MSERNLPPVPFVMPVVAAFDYALLDADQVDDLHKRAERIRIVSTKITSNVIDIGNELCAAKSHLDHGQFGDWVVSECGFSVRAAQRFMTAARYAAGKSDAVSLLSPTLLYKLAAKSTSKEIGDEVFRRLQSGEQVSDEVVTAAVLEARSHRRAQQRKDRARTRRKTKTKSPLEEREREVERERAEAREAGCAVADLILQNLPAKIMRKVKALGAHSSHWDFESALRQRLFATGDA